MTAFEFVPPSSDRTLGIVIHYGDPALTLRCLRAVAAGSTRPAVLALVDNGPEAFPPEPLDDIDLPVRLIRSGRNLGFAAGVNTALGRNPGFRFAWLLNNDAEPSPSAFHELTAAGARVDEYALVSSLIQDESGATWFERARFYPWRLESKHVRARFPVEPVDRDPGRRSIWAIPYLPGCSLLVPLPPEPGRGLLDPGFFVYGEDIDLAVQAAARGWPLVVARRSIVLHSPSSSTSDALRERLIACGSIRVVIKAYPWLIPVSLLGGFAIGLVRAARDHRTSLFTQRLLGYRDGLAGRSRRVPQPGRPPTA